MKSVSYLILLHVASLTVPVMQKTHVFATSSFPQMEALDFLDLLQHISSFDMKCALGMLISRQSFLGQRKVSIPSMVVTLPGGFHFGLVTKFALA